MLLTMPGNSYRGDLPPLTPHERQLQSELQADLQYLSGEIGEHNYFHYDGLKQAEDFLVSRFESFGYTVNLQEYEANQQKFNNIEVEIPGTDKAEEILVIGAHYDSVVGSPGANDNGSGTVAILALAKALVKREFSRTVRLVEFVNEEPPFFWTEEMGSLVYAKKCRDRNDNIIGMLSLETIGYYSEQPGSQDYPLGLLDKVYPITGNFLAFIGNFSSRKFVKQVIQSFRTHTQFPSEGTTLPDGVSGVGWSDHWSFWQVDYPALMVTDTAPFRYPHYHTPEDTPDKVNYAALARVVAGLERVIVELVSY
ncbi:M28 family peptidase [Spirulina sp. CS-785/01]|uniref:M28 family peptidase n=1 Tax=Spirulina sp. CS-785/01 TaxID=3021716 RepID=UPI00232D8120|nr:M28 family peptidase [Spirulina sp. CS-785/01]MDB9312368.1 M28 family peptidase [Spirulina sp. CS-785/01]